MKANKKIRLGFIILVIGLVILALPLIGPSKCSYLVLPHGRATCLMFNKTGKLLAIGNSWTDPINNLNRGSVYVVDVATSKILNQLLLDDLPPVSSVWFSNTADLLVFVADDGVIRNWAWRNNKVSVAGRILPGGIVVVSPEGDRAVAFEGQTMHVLGSDGSIAANLEIEHNPIAAKIGCNNTITLVDANGTICVGIIGENVEGWSKFSLPSKTRITGVLARSDGVICFDDLGTVFVATGPGKVDAIGNYPKLLFLQLLEGVHEKNYVTFVCRDHIAEFDVETKVWKTLFGTEFDSIEVAAVSNPSKVLAIGMASRKVWICRY
jgi:hypothetical protein